MGVDLVKVVKTEIKFDLAQKNACYSMQDCKDMIIPVVWENIDGYEEYPEKGRIVLHFGDDIETIKEIFDLRKIKFEK